MDSTSQAQTRPRESEELQESSALSRNARNLLGTGTLTLFALIILLAYNSPFAYMISTSLKNRDQISRPNAPLWPAEPATFEYEGEQYEIFRVPTDDGIQEWALVTPRRQESRFVDPENPEAGLITWQGQWRQLEPAWQARFQWSNYRDVWELPSRDFGFETWLLNTFAIAALGIIGTLISCTLVAYGFSRFRIPHKGLLFVILISTIFLPRIVLTVPMYALFVRIGWVGTWLPLVVPHFFANAYNVFWLRQYFMTIPRELDESAMIDGANPLQVLWHVILPQAKPAIVAVALFHMVFAFKDYFEPLIYLATTPELQPLSVGIQQFNDLYGQRPELIQTAALMGLFVPVLVFFLAQRVFLQGVVFTGVEK